MTRRTDRPHGRSLVLTIVGIRQRNPLAPNGRVFQRLAGPIPRVTVAPGGKLVDITAEGAFAVRVMRWLDPPLRHEVSELVDGRVTDPTRLRAFGHAIDEYAKAKLPIHNQRPSVSLSSR